jgi:hypothetical protein
MSHRRNYRPLDRFWKLCRGGWRNFWQSFRVLWGLLSRPSFYIVIPRRAMPKKARVRSADEPVQATFKIAYDRWQQFQQRAKGEGTTASATLLAFVERYLADSPIESASQSPVLEASIAAYIQEMVNQQTAQKTADLEAKLSQMQAEIAALESRLRQEFDRLDRPGDERSPDADGPSAVDVSENIELEILEGEIIENGDDIPIPQSSSIDPDHLPPDWFGISEQALCDRFGLNPNNIARHAQMRGLSTSEYLHQVTGWIYENGRYYPLEE